MPNKSDLYFCHKCEKIIPVECMGSGGFHWRDFEGVSNVVCDEPPEPVRDIINEFKERRRNERAAQ